MFRGRLFDSSGACELIVRICLLFPFVNSTANPRERISINNGWTFIRTLTDPDGIVYDNRNDTAARKNLTVLKLWIIPSANDFIVDPDKHYSRPATSPNVTVPFVQSTFNDTTWESVSLPHDWAIKGPFYVGDSVPVGGGMGRLPSHGIAWYRRKVSMTAADEGKTVYLDVDGAMSYAMIWLNGNLVGGWPYGYNSFRLDLTPYLKPGDDNQLAIRLDNPVDSSRWYPGGGLYRNVWLTKVSPVHVVGSPYIHTQNVTDNCATAVLAFQFENQTPDLQAAQITHAIHLVDSKTQVAGEIVAFYSEPRPVSVQAGNKKIMDPISITIEDPQLWGPPPTQTPNKYVLITTLSVKGAVADTVETRFGIRDIAYDSNQGLLVNGEHVLIQGVNQHHDLGALGGAFNVRAAERQLEVLEEMGCNAIRMSHNPPAPELLAMTDGMGFLVIDEIFDCWERSKTVIDFHLIFQGWQEPDLRSFIRRDRNHPSVIIWSIGNEVGEQTLGDTGTVIAQRLHKIVTEEDPTRQIMASMNAAKPNMSFPSALDIISLNYQGEGIRDAPDYSHLTTGTHTRHSTPPSTPNFLKR